MFFGFEGCGIASGVWLARRLYSTYYLLSKSPDPPSRVQVWFGV